MTVLLVLGVWLVLACITATLFAALVRHRGVTSLPEALPSPVPAVPLQRSSQDAAAGTGAQAVSR